MDGTGAAPPPYGGSHEVKGVIPRTGLILHQLLTPGVAGLSASDIARRCRLPVQTVHRLLAELSRCGLTFQAGGTRLWTLGPLALALGEAAGRQISIVRVAHPGLVRLTERTGETTILTIRDQDSGVNVDIVDSPHRLRLTEHVGLRLPLTTGASRRVILAHLPVAEREDLVEQLTGGGDVARRLDEELDRIRRQGYATSRGEVTGDTVGIAVAMNLHGLPAASLMMAGPASRLPTRSWRDAARAVAEEAQAIAAEWQPAATRKDTE